MKRAILLLVLSLTMASPAIAQLHGGNINGAVTDQQGGALPGATVVAQGVDFSKETTTTSDGAYHFLDLAPGSYKITASLSGFQTLVRDGVIVEIGRDIDVAFSPRAAVAETVTVDAPAPMVNSTPVGTATNFTHDELTNIPTSRDPFALMRTVPGVLTDRVNVAGNETGQQLLTVAKASRPQDTSWTLDGVEITDMAASGQSATYFNFDNFDEIHISTADNDIRERTGALTIDLSVKRGGNQFHGEAHGYYAGNSLQATNTPIELSSLATPVTAATSDHLIKNSDYGFEFGGPIIRDRAWFFGSYSAQSIQVYRRSLIAANATDSTTLRDPNVKVNIQATKKDLVNFLWYNGYKIKDNRAPGLVTGGSELPAATWHQENLYADNKLHGLFKIADDRVFNSHLIASAKYAYFNTGISLTPEGGVDAQAARNLSSAAITNGAGTIAPLTAYGSTQLSLNTRPQKTGTLDLDTFFGAFGLSHDLKLGGGYRSVESTTVTQYPGNGILALYMAPGTAGVASGMFAEPFRGGNVAIRANYLDFYIGDTMTRGRVTLDAGARYDKQWGLALPSTAAASPAFPALLPAVTFVGYRSPFTWKNFSPRAGLLYALDKDGRTTARLSFSQAVGQLSAAGTGPIGYQDTAGTSFYVFPWTDSNGDGYAQPSEVNSSTVISSGGINTTNPSSFVASPNQIDPNLKAPLTRSVVGGLERQLGGELALSATYTYSRTTNLADDGAFSITPRVGVPGGLGAGYIPATILTGVLPNGAPYSVQTYSAVVTSAVNGGFIYTNVPGYYISYNGVELTMLKRMSHRWMARASFGYNDARQNFSTVAGQYDTNGNPTPTLAEPLVNGGAYAPQQNGGSGNYYLNSKWKVNLDGMYEAPYGIELAGNIYGRQGYPFPIAASATLGKSPAQDAFTSSSLVLVSPAIDTFRYPNVWDTDARVAKTFKLNTITVRAMFDVFNLLNANTALVRSNVITSPATFQTLTVNMTPRVARLGLTIGF
ncbi:MAG TPA: carboxypeptidase regulatory-like domain-containing protein [Vicinamibacterales bacterium]|nr:carboxypeptidase regulatory-like domain-containing protein [Vicinamibacterales bacterium]